MPHNHWDRCWRASVPLKCPGARNQKSFGLIAQFDLPSFNRGVGIESKRSSVIRKKQRKICNRIEINALATGTTSSKLVGK